MKKLLYLSVLLILLFSCKKEEVDNSLPQVYPDYSPEFLGSYWVYEEYKIDSMGVETKTNRIDSVVFVGDSIVNNIKYAHYNHYSNGNFISIGMQRDSLSYMVNPQGEIFFSSADFNRVFFEKVELMNGIDTLYELKIHADPQFKSKTVTAGSFTCLVMILNYRQHMKQNQNTKIIDVQHSYYYAENIGLISYSYSYFFQPKIKYERRLRSHFINHVSIPN